MTTQTPERTLWIGEAAKQVGVTTRTIRYYEQLGLLGANRRRVKGARRLYSEADIVRLQQVIRLRDLLGLSLEEVVALAEAEEARQGLRSRWADTLTDAEQARILDAAIPHVERQLELVRARQHTLAEFVDELTKKLHTLRRRRATLQHQPSRSANRGGGGRSAVPPAGIEPAHEV